MDEYSNNEYIEHNENDDDNEPLTTRHHGITIWTVQLDNERYGSTFRWQGRMMLIRPRQSHAESVQAACTAIERCILLQREGVALK